MNKVYYKDKLLELKKELTVNYNLKNKLKDKKLDFEMQIVSLVEDINTKEENIKQLKLTLTEEGKQEFKETNNKKLLGGLSVRVGTEYKYLEADAFKWAGEHKLCLQLNKKVFENLIKNQKLDFVTEDEKITITFPKEIIIEDEASGKE